MEMNIVKDKEKVEISILNHELQSSGSYTVSRDEYQGFLSTGTLISQSASGMLYMRKYPIGLSVMLLETEDREVIFCFQGVLNGECIKEKMNLLCV